MPSGIHHFAIQVKDLPGAERFYREVLGFAVLERWPSHPGTELAPGDRAVWLDPGEGAAGGAFVALERVTGDQPTAADERGERSRRPGHHLVAFRIHASERASWERRLAAAGIPVTHRTAFTLYFTDPEGNRLGLSHFPQPVAPVEVEV